VAHKNALVAQKLALEPTPGVEVKQDNRRAQGHDAAGVHRASRDANSAQLENSRLVLLCPQEPPVSTLRRHFGINTTWYLHSHLVWLRLSISSIVEIPSRVLDGSRLGVFSVDSCIGQTSTAFRQSRGVSRLY
jgi:hypothetical protein